MRTSEEALKNKKLLFYRLPDHDRSTGIQFGVPVTVECFKPSLFRLKAHPDRKLIYIFWYIFTAGRYRIYYGKDSKGKIIHYSHILPKFFKFPFMKKDDIEIGPCWTHGSYRGKNIYPAMLSYISKELNKDKRTFYIMADEENTASQNGIEKAGFKLFAAGIKTGVLGIYKPTRYLQTILQ